MADTQDKKPAVWQMVRQGIEALGGKTTNVALRDWILKHYPGTNTGTIQCQITVLTVNHDSRIHFQRNKKPRIANGQYDLLFRPTSGQLELYEPKKHGIWEIFANEDGRLSVRPVDTEPPDNGDDTEGKGFAAEAHLRDYLALHLEDIEQGLTLYTDDDGDRTGVEYMTPIGRIDILAEDTDGGFVVLELKVGQGPDKAAGQILRYKNWIHLNMANGRRTRGIIIARHISDKLKYAIASDPDIGTREYEISMTLTTVPGVGPDA
jgi:endonuclease NucS-like protein